MRWCAQIGINPTGKRPGQAALQPDPSKDRRGSKEEAKPKIIESDGSPLVGLFNRSG